MTSVRDETCGRAKKQTRRGTISLFKTLHFAKNGNENINIDSHCLFILAALLLCSEICYA